MRSRAFIWRAAGVAALAWSIISVRPLPVSAQADQAWPPAAWPSTLSDSPAVRDRLAHTDFTAEEKRNLMRVLTGLSPETRAPRGGGAGAGAAPAVTPTRLGWAGLFELHGEHDYSIRSTADRVDKIEDIIAKGNRVWGVFKIVGHHTGSMFGWPGDGRPIDYREMFYRTFDVNGTNTAMAFRSEELQIYTDLGGKVAFPKDAAAVQAAATPSPNAPRPFLPPTDNPFGQKPTWNQWPPAQWPDTIRKPELVKTLTDTAWTAEEKRNLQTLMEELVFRLRIPAAPASARQGNAGRAGGAAPAGGAIGRRGFDGLDELAGFHGYNAAISVPDRRNEIEDIIAKGNRVWVVFVGRGTHAGPFYGFPATGKPLMWRELGYVEYDKNGRATHMDFRSEELELYVSLGGKVQFPGKSPVPDHWDLDQVH